MALEQLKMTLQEYKRLSQDLKSQGLSTTQINSILNGQFSSFEKDDDVSEVFDDNNNFQNILQFLSDGYTMDELESKGIKSQDIDKFKTMLKKCKLTVENAKAINQYSNGSNMILSIKRGNTSRDKIKQGIIDDLTSKLEIRGISQENISQIKNMVQQLDYQRPVHENYDMLRNSLKCFNIPNNCYPTINTAIKHFDSYEHIDETIKQLDEGLSKSSLPHSVKLYRAIKSNSIENVENLSGKVSENNGYISTSPLYDASFAKYDEYDTVMELYVPKGTRGTYISPFSDYDSTEQEVLLDSNDIFFINAQTGVVDKNGRTKNILKGVVLSKDKDCYKDIETQYIKQSNTSNSSTAKKIQRKNLSVMQNRFLKFLSKIRAKFQKRRNLSQAGNGNLKYETHYEKSPIMKKSNNKLGNSLKEQIYGKADIIQHDTNVLENFGTKQIETKSEEIPMIDKE